MVNCMNKVIKRDNSVVVSTQRLACYLPGILRHLKTAVMSLMFMIILASCGDEPGSEKRIETNATRATSSVDNHLSSSPRRSANQAMLLQKTLVYAFNIGGAEYTAKDGTVYQAEPKNFLTMTGRTNDVSYVSEPIANTEDDVLYQYQRYGMFTFNLPVENGNYDIVVQLAEPWADNVNQRIMNVTTEEVPVIVDLDLIVNAGKFVAYDRTFTGIQVLDGNLTIELDASQDFATVSALRIYTTETVPNNNSSQQAYQDFGCLACHGNDGLQVSQPIIFENYTLETLTQRINDTMPVSELDPNAWMRCIGECAIAVAEYLWSLRPLASCDNGEKILSRRVRNLSKFEYINTINDLFSRSDGESLASGIGSDTEVQGFDNNAYASAVTSTRLEAYWNAAKDIAPVVNVSPWLSTNNCNQQGIAACFVSQFGRSAFRRPLNSEEMLDYTAIFTEGANDEAGARYVVQAMLISPNFLYRSEIASNGRLTPYEMASLLSYTFWGSTPSEPLLDMAANNQLSNTAQIKQAVETLLADPKSERQFVHFGRQWLQVDELKGIDRDSQLFPQFTDAVASAMDRELELFLQEMLLQDGYNMNDFFNWEMTFANSTLANFYELNGAGNQMTKINAGNDRGGVLRLGAVLARNAKFNESHPIKRGLLVRRNLLCQAFGVPPANVGEVEPFDPSKPTRERFAAHSQNATCASCHQYIDEIGFAFENYDAVGKYRTQEANGDIVDASGIISGLDRMTVPDSHAFSDLADLSLILGTTGMQSTSSCVAEQFQRMMDGEAKPDACTVSNTVSRWNPNVNSLKDLWVEMVASQTFMQRQ